MNKLRLIIGCMVLSYQLLAQSNTATKTFPGSDLSPSYQVLLANSTPSAYGKAKKLDVSANVKPTSSDASQTQALISQALKQNKTMQHIFFIGLLLLVVASAGLVFSYFFKKEKKLLMSVPLQTKHQSLVEQHQHLLQETKQLRDELAIKHQQMANHSLHMIHKNQILKELRQLVNQLRLLHNISDAKKLHGKLANLTDYGISLDKDWESFQSVFEQIHPSFFTNLQAKFPQLTAGEVQVCALLKLNLGTKTIAALQGIAADSVRMKRYRIRQKMGLNSEAKLKEALIGMEATAA